MGGTSSQQQQTSQTSDYLDAAKPAINGILGQLAPLAQNSGLSSGSTNAINQLEQTAQQGNPYAPQISANTTNLLNGGGANNQAGAVNSGYQNYYNQTNPLASNTNYDPYNTPGLSDALNTLKSDITGSVNGQFAAAGRDFSGANQQALGRGLMQGLAPALLGQYNQNVQNQQGAAGNLYNAGNTTSGLLTGMNQQGLANQQQGIANSSDALAAQNYSPTQQLQLEQMRQQLPAQNLGLLAQIGVPIAQLGGTKTGTSNTTNEMSGAQQFGTIAGGIGSLGTGLANQGFKLFSDRRLKRNITRISTTHNGLGLYHYQYVWGGPFQIGVMADEVEKIKPDAVETVGGYKVVDYKKALEVA